MFARFAPVVPASVTWKRGWHFHSNSENHKSCFTPPSWEILRKSREVMAENPEGGVAQETGGYDYKRLHSYPLIRYSDMNDEMRTEAMELCVTACEKFSANNEAAAKMIKESMDKKFGSSWHAVVGEGYGFELTHEVKNLLYMFFGGTVAVCIWKCS